MLQINDIHFRIAPSLTLSNISFEVQPGELVVILGANGAGKSTLLKVITGDIRADKGSVILNNKRHQDWLPEERARTCAVLLQQNPLQLPFSVAEVVMMGRYPHFARHAAAYDQQMVATALEQTGITHLADRNYLTLSGGEQQRVHLARVLAQISDKDKEGVKFLFMDEPSNNLDIRHQHNALTIARDFAAAGNCVLAVLHDLNLALQYADKILLLKNGELKGFGLPGDVMTGPAISDVYGLPLEVFHHPSRPHAIVMPVFKS